jgi:hypothetical protein
MDVNSNACVEGRGCVVCGVMKIMKNEFVVQNSHDSTHTGLSMSGTLPARRNYVETTQYQQRPLLV